MKKAIIVLISLTTISCFSIRGESTNSASLSERELKPTGITEFDYGKSFHVNIIKMLQSQAAVIGPL